MRGVEVIVLPLEGHEEILAIERGQGDAVFCGGAGDHLSGCDGSQVGIQPHDVDVVIAAAYPSDVNVPIRGSDARGFVAGFVECDRIAKASVNFADNIIHQLGHLGRAQASD